MDSSEEINGEVLNPEQEGYEVKKFFLFEKSYEEAKNFFRKKRKKILGLFATTEKIGRIEKKARPLGLFIVRQMKGGNEIHEKRLFVDLNSAEIYSLKGPNLKRDSTLKKILELPSDIQENFLHMITEHKGLDYGDFPRKHLATLEKKGLVHITGKGQKNFLVSLADHFLELIIIFTDLLGELLHLKPTEFTPTESDTIHKVNVNFKPLEVDRSCDLNFYLESEKIERLPKEFELDGMKHNPKEIGDILTHLLSSEVEVKFKEVVYLPYYSCHYTNLTEREVLFFPLKFKSFTSHFTGMGYKEVYLFIDKAPEVPFLFLAFLYAAYIYPDLKEIAFIFSSSFIFVLLALFIGFFLKIIFKKERAVPYLTTSPMRYGFPSLHSLTSLGTISFVYFIPDLGLYLSLALIPLGFLYVYSRLKLKVHSLRDVLGGGIIGLILGAICGYFLLFQNVLSLPHNLELAFAVLFFVLPIFSILYRIKVGYLP